MTRHPNFVYETEHMYARRVAQEAATQAAADRQEADNELCHAMVLRAISDLVGGAKRCPDKACRRARACVGKHFACTDIGSRSMVGRRRLRGEARAVYDDLQMQRREGLLDDDISDDEIELVDDEADVDDDESVDGNA